MDLNLLKLSPTASIRDALACINRNSKGVALVTDEKGDLLATITDGDIRRAILRGNAVDDCISVVWKLDEHGQRVPPFTMLSGTPQKDMLAFMSEQGIRQLPITEASGHIVDVVFLQDLIRETFSPINAVVMAGGFGKRLFPLTKETPKPMLPVAGKPILEHVLGNLQQAGISDVKITTHYKSDKIEDYFGDGSAMGLNIEYVNEDEPLGTAGALGLIEPSDQPTLVLNADILTNVDYRAMLQFHRDHGAALTVGVREYDVAVPFGVVHSTDAEVTSIEEKPVFSFFVNAGIYLLEPKVMRLVPHQERLDMPDLINMLLRENRRSVMAFPIVEYWLDVGQHADYAQANTDGAPTNL
ncbi:N/A [soil metagenome]